MDFSDISLHNSAELEQLVLNVGFLPFFKNKIPGFSVEEMTPREYWFNDEVEGPWEWKMSIVRNWNCAYGTIFDGKSGYISLDWYPHLVNYRRSKFNFSNAPLDADGINRQKFIYDMVVANESMLSRDIKRACPFIDFPKKKLTPQEKLLGVRKEKVKGESFDKVISVLQMSTMLAIADFEYECDRHGNPYGWGLARYVAPETLYGDRVLSAACTPEESFNKMFEHLRRLLPEADELGLKKLLQ